MLKHLFKHFFRVASFRWLVVSQQKSAEPEWKVKAVLSLEEVLVKEKSVEHWSRSKKN